MSRNQTASFLIRRFREVGIRPGTKRGQNFLIDLNLQNLIVESAGLGPDDVVLEVGTGTGSLTARMAERAGAVVSFEIDPQLYQLATEELTDIENVILIRLDVLRNKNNLHPRVMEAVRQQMDHGPGRRLKLVSNLPYNIATPVVSNLLSAEPVPVSMTVTIQKELADRIHAAPNSKDYGALTIWVQSQCQTELVRTLPPSVFWPRPKVSSAILHITLDRQKQTRIPDRAFFHGFVRRIFLHRRKFLRSVIHSAFKKELDKSAIERIMDCVGIDRNSRAEQLGVDTMLALCEAVRAEIGMVQKGGRYRRANGPKGASHNGN